MKKAALVVAGIFFALTATAQETKNVIAGNGNIEKQKREIANFSKLYVSGAFTVCLTSDKNKAITLEGDENVLDLITTTVENGTLSIKTLNDQPIKASMGNRIKIKVPCTMLTDICLKGCGTITANKRVNAGSINLKVDGPGKIDIGVSADEIYTRLLGSGTIAIKGESKKLECRVVGSGNIKACDLEASEVTALISGSGNIHIKSNISLTGRIVGTGNIAFVGTPQKTDLKHLGSGSYSWQYE